MRPFGTIRASTAGGARGGTALTVLAKSPDRGPLEARRIGLEYVFEGLEPATYAVYVGASADVPPDAVAVELRDGDAVSVELALPQMLQISGHLVDAHGMAVVDAWVRASPVDFGRDDQTDAALSDEQGEFTLQNLLPGSYDVAASDGQRRSVAHGIPAGTSELRLELASGAAASSI
jgi:hypothetical protein